MNLLMLNLYTFLIIKLLFRNFFYLALSTRGEKPIQYNEKAFSFDNKHWKNSMQIKIVPFMRNSAILTFCLCIICLHVSCFYLHINMYISSKLKRSMTSYSYYKYLVLAREQQHSFFMSGQIFRTKYFREHISNILLVSIR